MYIHVGDNLPLTDRYQQGYLQLIQISDEYIAASFANPQPEQVKIKIDKNTELSIFIKSSHSTQFNFVLTTKNNIKGHRSTF